MLGASGPRGGRRRTTSQRRSAARVTRYVTFEWPSPIGATSTSPEPRPSRVEERAQRVEDEQRLARAGGGPRRHDVVRRGPVHEGEVRFAHAGRPQPCIARLVSIPVLRLVPLSLAAVPAAERSRERVAHAGADLRGPPRPHEPGHPPGRARRAAVARRALAARHPDVARRRAGRRPDHDARELRADRPEGLRLGRVRAAARRRQGAQLAGAADDLRAGPDLGDGLEARQPHPPEHDGLRRLHDRRRAASSASRSTRGRSGTSPTSRSSCARSSPAAARPPRRGSTASSTAPACAGLQKAGQGNDTILIGETSPRGTARVVAPLRFLRAMLCLDAKYKKIGKCGALSPDGYAHHAYTTRQGPFFKPPQRDDVTIGVLGRLTKALDRARAAGALTKRLPIHLTEFGIQSTPDTTSGVSLAKQVEYRAISERIAFDNPRVVSFSQYLLRDSDPAARAAASTAASSRACASPTASRSPRCRRSGCRSPSGASARRRRSGASCGPPPGVTTATITYANRGSSRFLPLRNVTTNAFGYFSLRTSWRAGRRWNVTWQGQTGSPVGSYTR